MNELVSFGCVPKLKHLKRLNVAQNHIAKVSGIDTLTELDTLDLSRNGITDIPVGMLPSCLGDLILEGNHLSSGSFLYGKRSARARADHSEVLCGVPNLATLLLGGNEFRDVSTFPPVPSLLDLDLNNNKVESLRGIDDKVPNLEVLDVSGNYLKTLDQLSALDMLMALSDLTLESNPVVADHTEGEVLEAMAHFPALDHVNGRPFARGTMQRLGLPLEKSQLEHLQQELGAGPRPALAQGGERPPSAAGERVAPDLSTTLSLSRPGTSSSRPGTSSGRPGTSGGREGEQAEGVRKSAAHLEARGVKDPLMFARPQLSTKRCWISDQVEQECTRVLTAAS